MRHIFGILTLVSIFIFTACSDNDPVNNIDNPTTYNFTRNGVSTISFSGQTTRIGMATELVNAMNDFDQTRESLLEMVCQSNSIRW